MITQAEFNDIFILIEKDKSIRRKTKTEYLYKLFKLALIFLFINIVLCYMIEYKIFKILITFMTISIYFIIISNISIKYDNTLKSIIMNRVKRIVNELKNDRNTIPKEFFEIDRAYLPN